MSPDAHNLLTETMSPQETTETTAGGITLAVLAPYLAHKIPVAMYSPEWPQGDVGTLSGLSVFTDSVEVVVGNDDYRLLRSSQCLPVLRPFRALGDRLPDGTVPAVEVAKLMLASVIDALDWPNALPNEDEDRIEVQIPVRGKHPWLLHIQADYTITCYNTAGIEKEVTAWRAIDYLRSQHFAVGLRDSQFITK